MQQQNISNKNKINKHTHLYKQTSKEKSNILRKIALVKVNKIFNTFVDTHTQWHTHSQSIQIFMCVNKYKCFFCKTSTPPSRHQRPEKQNKNTCTFTYSVTIRKRRRSKLSTGELITTAKDPRKTTATIPVIYAEHKQTKCYAVRERENPESQLK